jgi:1-acyl-sn-glycerol-3-phosphate acyltransferase
MTSPTWQSDAAPEQSRITPMGWIRIAVRGLLVGIVTFGCLGLLLIVRLIERPLFGLHRPVTPFITQFVCITAFWFMGLKRRVIGRPMAENGAIVANHGSWLDIFALNASKRIYFVSKAEVAGWPGIGWLARATGTVFITRRSTEAKTHKSIFEDRIRAGHKLLFFPEGTSTDTQRVLPFKPTLFAAFFNEDIASEMYMQPVTVVYHAPPGADPRFYGWWGDMAFGTHLLKTLAASPQGCVDVIYHDPVRVADFADRKALSQHLERIVRAGLPFEQDDAKAGHPE